LSLTLSEALIVVLALMGRVLTVPLKVSPVLVKVPMVAMECSCLFLGTAPIAASMAIDRPEAIDAAAVRPAAQRRTAAGRLSCLARNGRSPGEES
jgi:hypothetical protein